jgi:hypothetical protein
MGDLAPGFTLLGGNFIFGTPPHKRQTPEKRKPKKQTPRSVNTDDLKQKEQRNTLRKETTNISPAVHPIPPPTYLSTNKTGNPSPKGLIHPDKHGVLTVEGLYKKPPVFVVICVFEFHFLNVVKEKAPRYVEKNIKDDALYDRYADWSHACPSI